MKQYIFNFKSLDNYRSEITKIEAEINCHSKNVLVQIYSRELSKEQALLINKFTKEILDNSSVVICSTPGEISKGTLQEGVSVASITRFDSSQIETFFTEIIPNSEIGIGDKFGQTIANGKEDIKCILFFITPEQIRSHHFIHYMGKHLKDIPFIGAGIDTSCTSYILCNERLSTNCATAIVLKGENLEVDLNTIRGWKPIGRKIRITCAKNNNIFEIDKKPAVQIYEQYVGSDKNSILDDTQLFPLIFERDGHSIARVPNKINTDGSISFLADLYEEEEFRLGYGDIYTMEQEICIALQKLSKFKPDSIYLFPCMSRKMFLEEDIEHEIKPFEKLAPTVGFLSKCEISSDCGNSNTLNATYLTLGLKEISQHKTTKENNLAKFHLSPHAKRTAKLMYFMSQITDELIKANNELENHSKIDFLTGALNRRAFNEHLKFELIKNRRYGSNSSLIMMDIDYFKQVNDNYGHLTGDEILILVSQIVKTQIRESDLFARYGGEEFILFLPETNIKDTKSIVERIRKMIEQETLANKSAETPAITCSFGVSPLAPFDDEVTLIKRADDALYHAKKSGRNKIEIAEMK